jgi:hypothetical protein
MNHDHQPTPEFVSNLEWQIRTAHQRGNRFSEPTEFKNGGIMKISVLVLASALVGAGGVVVKDGVQGLRAQEVLLTQVEGDLRMAGLRLQIARNQLEEVERMHQVGAIQEQALLESRVHARQAEAEYMKLSLDQEEVRSSGKGPQNELSAPLVDGRDFVAERLVLDEMVAAERLTAARAQFRRYQDLVAVGVIRSEELSEPRLALREAESQLTGIGEKISLRSRFLDGEMAPEDAMREYEISETQTRVDLLRQAYEAAVAQYRGVEERVDLGMIHESELLKARLQLMQAESQLELMELKLVALRGGRAFGIEEGRGG